MFRKRTSIFGRCSESARDKADFSGYTIHAAGESKTFQSIHASIKRGGGKATLGWLFFAFLFGGLCAQWRISRAPAAMRRRFMRVDSFQGCSYADILFLARRSPNRVIVRSNGQIIRIWQAHAYRLALLYSPQDECLVVEEEWVGDAGR